MIKDRWLGKWKPPKIVHGKLTKYGWIVLYPENLKIGYGVDIGAFSLIHAGACVEIEDYVQIGSHCSIYSVSSINNKQGKVVLKMGCAIGSHVVIMPSVTVGERAICGAGSYIDKDVPPNTVLIPKQKFIIKKRFL